jgi:tRNA-Thr(GGU) m(6)t(6)A37 methyltransferase TsaA
METPLLPIGTLKSCFGEKFGVPRQSLMISEAWAILKLNPNPQFKSAVKDLDRFTHLWLVFLFHRRANRPWRSTIESPRVEIKQKIGVFASRSPDRPNPIGLSAVKLERIDTEAEGGIEIHLSGVDILDGTPVLDIKPYLPYADRIESAGAGWADAKIEKYDVSFSKESLAYLAAFETEMPPRFRQLVEQMLQHDPRPTSQRRVAAIRDPKSQGKQFAFRVDRFDVHWKIWGKTVRVTEIRSLTDA